MTLRLSQLPDRTPAKLTLALDPETYAALLDYAALYQQAYGSEEKPETLAAAMIDTFLTTDAGFRRARRALHAPASKGD